MRASMITAVLFIFLAISGCGTLDHKTILSNVGDSKETVLQVMGTPQDRQISGQQEACNTAYPAQDLVGMTIKLFG